MKANKALDVLVLSVQRDLKFDSPGKPKLSTKQRRELKIALMRLHETINRDWDHENDSLARRLSEKML